MWILGLKGLKGRLLWLLVLVVTSQWISQHQFGHLTRADPENSERGGPGGGTPIYGLYRYVPRNRVWFLRFSVLK